MVSDGRLRWERAKPRNGALRIRMRGQFHPLVRFSRSPYNGFRLRLLIGFRKGVTEASGTGHRTVVPAAPARPGMPLGIRNAAREHVNEAAFRGRRARAGFVLYRTGFEPGCFARPCPCDALKIRRNRFSDGPLGVRPEPAGHRVASVN